LRFTSLRAEKGDEEWQGPSMRSEEFLQLELLVLVLLVLVLLVVTVVAVTVTTSVDNVGGASDDHALRASLRGHHAGLHHGLHARLHHGLHAGLHAGLHHRLSRVLLHAGLHHAGLLHAGLLHAGLHHTGLLHARLHHAGLLHAGLHHAGLHHAGLHHTRLHHAGLHHTRLHHTGLHHAGLCRAFLLSSTTGAGLPDGLQVDLTSSLASVSDSEPLVHTVADTKSGELEGDFADNVISADILVVNLDGHIVTDVLDIDIESLIPDWRLASALLGLRPELLLARSDLDVRVHLAEGLRIAC